MKVYNYSKLDHFYHGVSKVALMTLFLGLVFSAIFKPSDNGYIYIFLLASQVIAFLGSLLIGLPVTLLLNKYEYKNKFISALVCGLVVFLFLLFYMNDGKFLTGNWKALTLYTTYGVCCGFAFSYGYNKEVRK